VAVMLSAAKHLKPRLPGIPDVYVHFASARHSERSEESQASFLATTPSDLLKVRQYYVYLLSNYSRRLYVGVTNNLQRRLSEHKQKFIPGFMRNYNLNRLVYYETTRSIRSAIIREKQIKGWLRGKKVALIESANPEWKDLSEVWK
jgi:putative endonuclease